MKHIISLLATILLAVAQVSAADVDLATAQAIAERYVRGTTAGTRLAGKPAAEVKLLHAEMNSSRPEQAVYYIFNGGDGFVIVSGDDRAQEILAHGDRPLDPNRIPDNMRFWLGTYKKQLEYLQADPGLVVEVTKPDNSLKSAKVGPLLTAEWDQVAPYNNYCPTYSGMRCLTGCTSTSLAMVFYYWKYPTAPTPPVEGYTNVSPVFDVPALPSITFDWDNMLDKYVAGSYNDAQADAVAWLMRYLGQEEKSQYTPSLSGAMGTDILRAVKFFGYDESARIEYKTILDVYGNDSIVNYTDDEWADILRNEMFEGRPVVYCAYDYTYWTGWNGHAFNIDGYNAKDNTYHVNWGWSGDGNGEFALNAFKVKDYSFEYEQQMILGIQPPVTGPAIKVSPPILDMYACVEDSATATFTVRGQELGTPIVLTLNDESGAFSIDEERVPISQEEEGKLITVTYAPQQSGTHTATITLSTLEATGAVDKTVTLYGTAVLDTSTPVMLPADSAFINLTQFRANWADETPDRFVRSYTLEVIARPAVELLATIDGSRYTGGYESITLGYPWVSNEVMGGQKAVYINNNNGNGYISYIVPSNYTNDVFTVQITTVGGSYGSGNITVGSNQTPAVGHQFSGGETYNWLVTASSGERITITTNDIYYSPDISMIRVYAGELDNRQSLNAVSENGDASHRVITGITDKFCLVKNLAEGRTFFYKVKATYIDGTQSGWSNSQRVNLFLNEHDYELGDVNHDGTVNITDVTDLIDRLLYAGGVCELCADIDGNGQIDINDVTSCIDMVLSPND